MAVKRKKKNVKTVAKSLPSPFNMYWEKTNYLLFALGMILVIIGFYLLGQGEWDSSTSLVISPILLFIGFVVIFPASIFYRKKSNEEADSSKVE